MVSIADALSLRHGADTQLDFFNPNGNTLEEQHFTLGELHPGPKPVTTQIHRQGTRRYCTKCRGAMYRSKEHGGSARGTVWKFTCAKGHEEWGR